MKTIFIIFALGLGLAGKVFSSESKSAKKPTRKTPIFSSEYDTNMGRKKTISEMSGQKIMYRSQTVSGATTKSKSIY